MVSGCQHRAQLSSWGTITCQLSAAAYSAYSQLPSVSGVRFSIHNLMMRHTVVTGRIILKLIFKKSHVGMD